MELTSIKQQVASAIDELITINQPFFRDTRLLVVGCSSSEIVGGVIGHASSEETGACVAQTVIDCAQKHGFAPAFQCCEHLNRALVMEKAEAIRRGYEIVCAVPQPKAGGSLAAGAWKLLKEPVLVESIQADAGLDIGLTMIGMHLHAVAVPIRLKNNRVGQALVTAARTRPKLIGGIRARYE